jgi:hypothetical protein
MTKLVTLVTLVGSLLVAGVASADTGPTTDRSAIQHRGDDAERGPRRGEGRLARRDGDQPGQAQRRGRHQRAAEGGRCDGKGKGMGMRKQRPDRDGGRDGDRDGRRGPRNDQPDRRDA